MSDVRYRHWQPGDDEGVLRILGPMGWCTAEAYATKFEDRGLRPDDVLIAELDGTIVGHLMLPHRRLRFGQATLPFGGVGMVVVDPAARGRGIGARLLDAAVAHHRAAGNALSGLFTMPSLLPAYEMYGRRGYVTVAERAVLHLAPDAIGTPPAGLQARPAAEHDRAAVTRLLDQWAAEHSGVSVEAAAEPWTNQRLVTRADSAVVGRLEIGERPDGQVVHRLLAGPDVSVAAVLAAGIAGLAVTSPRVITNTGNRAYAELAPLAVRAERDGGLLMVVSLGLARVLAGLAVEIAGRLRQAGAAPIEATLALVETGEQVRLAWHGSVLRVDDPPVDAAPVPITRVALTRGLMGQPAPPPSPALAPLWRALFPATRIEMRLVNCW